MAAGVAVSISEPTHATLAQADLVVVGQHPIPVLMVDQAREILVEAGRVAALMSQLHTMAEMEALALSLFAP